MVEFIRILAPVTSERILDADPNRTYLEFREDQNLGYWLNTKTGDVNTCLLLNSNVIFSLKRDGVNPTQEFYGFRNAALAVIQIIIETSAPIGEKQEQREAPIMDDQENVRDEMGIIESTWKWLFK